MTNANQAYPRDPLEDLDAEELMHIASYDHPFNSDRAARVAAHCAKKAASSRRRFVARRFAAALVAAAVLVLAGFSNGDRIRAFISEYFGGGDEIAQLAQDIGQECTDQGIQMKVTDAVNDGENTYLFIELADLAEDRLGGDLVVDGFDDWSLEGGRQPGGSGTCELLSYDADAKTAIVAVRAIEGLPGEQAVFTLSSFRSGLVQYDRAVPDIDLEEVSAGRSGGFVSLGEVHRTGASGGASHEAVVALAPGSGEIDLTGAGRSVISSVGYREGRLYVQVPDTDDIATVYLVNKRTGEKLEYRYLLGYSELPWTGDPSDENKSYFESVFEVEADRLQDYEIRARGFYYKSEVEGTWRVSFTIPERIDNAEASTHIAPEDVGLKDQGEFTTIIESVEVSPLSVTLRMAGGYLDPEGFSDIAVRYRDGSVLPLELESEFGPAWQLVAQNPRSFALVFKQYVPNLDQVVGVRINGYEVDLS